MKSGYLSLNYLLSWCIYFCTLYKVLISFEYATLHDQTLVDALFKDETLVKG